jgi:hypothetical protein
MNCATHGLSWIWQQNGAEDERLNAVLLVRAKAKRRRSEKGPYTRARAEIDDRNGSD